MTIDGDQPPHFVLLPFMAQGHLIPMVDIAKLLAKRGVMVSILLTPKNGERVKKVVDRAIASGLSIRVFHLNLPCAEAGLPQGCENFDALPSTQYLDNFMTAVAMLSGQVEDLLHQLNPTCLIADINFPWATDLALQLRIPRLLFHGSSCFSLTCVRTMRNSNISHVVASDTDYFVLPGLPHRIEITKAQLRGSASELPPQRNEWREKMLDSEAEAAGTVVNTFQELEHEYIRPYMKAIGKKVWCIGAMLKIPTWLREATTQ